MRRPRLSGLGSPDSLGWPETCCSTRAIGGSVKTSQTVSAFCFLLAAGVAQAQGTSSNNPSSGANELPVPRTALDEVHPAAAAPSQAPPMPPDQPPPLPSQTRGQTLQSVQQPVRSQDVAAGQWVDTSEYGWIWMPYGDQYTHEGVASDASPYAYAYYPSYGWMWLAAPWVWGWGTQPYFGSLGPAGFGWYRGHFRTGYGWGSYPGGGRSGYGLGGANRAGNGYGGVRRAGPSNVPIGGFRGGGGGNRSGFRGGVSGGTRGNSGGRGSFTGGRGGGRR